jgi:PAS domain S-box-containing protein
MNLSDFWRLHLTEATWREIILFSSVLVLLITVWCLAHGITIIFMHLYYIPIVLLAYHYRKKGLILSVLLTLLYLAITAMYEYGNGIEIEGAGIRAVLFVAVAALVVYLSEHLVKTRETLRKTTQIQQSMLQNANVWLMVLDSRGTIYLWNEAAEKMSGYVEGDVIGKNDIWKVIYPDKEYRKEITGKITEIIRENNYLKNLQTTIVCRDGSHKTILWNTRRLPLETDRIPRYIAIGVDITARTSAEDALKRSEEQYRHFFNTSRDCVFITSPDGRWIDFNDAAVDFFGYESRSELQKMNIPDLYQDRDERDKLLRQIGESGYSIEYPVNLRKKDGTIINALVTSVGVKNDKEEIIRYQGTIRDITENKRLENVLRASEEQYRALIETTGTGYVIIDTDGRVLDANPEYVRLTGYHTLREITGRSVVEWTATYEKEKNAEAIKKCARDGYIRNLEIDYADPNGKITPVEINATVVEIKHKPQILTLCRDITQRRDDEKRLIESEERYRTLAETSPDMIFIIGKDDTLNYANTAALKMFHLPADKVIGKARKDLFPPDIAKAQDILIRKVFGTGEHVRKEEKIQFGTQEFWIDTTIVPLIDEARNVTSILGVARDITERKRAEESLKKSQLELSAAMDLADLVNWEFDVLTGIFTFNDRFYAMYGTTAEREGGYQMPANVYAREFVHPDEINVVADEVKKAIATTDPDYVSQVEHRIIRRDGEIRHIVVRIAITKDAEGRTVKTHGANQDITERKKAEEELRQSEERYRNLFTNMLEGFAYCRILYDDQRHPSDFVYLNVNPAFDQIIGTKTVTGKRATEVFPGIKEAFPELFEIYGRVALTGQPAFFDLDFKPSGKWLHISAYSPAKEYFVAVFEDITNRKLMDEQLKQAEKKYRNIFENAIDGIYQITPKGQILTANPAMARILGYDSVHDLVTTVTDTARQLWVHQEQRKDYLRQLREHDIVQEFECEYYRKDKSRIWVSLTTHTIRGTDGKIIISEGILVDITRRKDAERELIDRESEYRTVLRTAMDGFGIISLNGRFLDVNDALCRLTGYTRDELLNLTIADIEAKETAEDVVQHSQKIIRKGEDRFETQYRRKDGSIIDIEVSVVASDRHGGQFITFHNDITERKRDREALVSARNELEQKVLERTSELKRTNEELLTEIDERNKAEKLVVQSLHEKEMLLREVHHRVKNNLQLIVSLLNLQSRLIHDENVLSAIKDSQNRVRVISIVHEKLYRSGDLSNIDLGDYLKFLATSLFHIYTTRPGTVALSVETHGMKADINMAIPIGLIINELVSNSLKYAFPDGRSGEIAITTQEDNAVLTLTVRDNGVGLPESIDWRNTASLGLQLVISLVEQIDGTIELNRDRGTTFIITARRKGE